MSAILSSKADAMDGSRLSVSCCEKNAVFKNIVQVFRRSNIFFSKYEYGHLSLWSSLARLKKILLSRFRNRSKGSANEFDETRYRTLLLNEAEFAMQLVKLSTRTRAASVSRRLFSLAVLLLVAFSSESKISWTEDSSSSN